MATLKSDRIRLSALGTSDVEMLYGWINDRDQALLNAPYRPVHAADHAEWFETIRGRNDVVIFGIRLLDGERLIGSCQLHAIDDRSKSAELQVRIGEPGARGRGYGSEALELLLGHAFDDLNLRRIALHVFATNETAIHVYEKLGFQLEGRLREAAYLDGQFVDVLVMGLLRDER